jgi:hypothetical protein
MVIDIHTHTFPDRVAAAAVEKLSRMAHTVPFTDGTAAGLARSVQSAGIDLAVVLPVATSPRQVEHINAASARLNEHTGETGIFSFGCIHPDCAHWRAQLDWVAEHGLKGVKLHPVYQGADLDDPRYLRILTRAGELGLVVVTHAGLDVGCPGQVRCSPAMARNALRQAGPVRLVLAHMGGWRCWDEVEALLADTPALLDTSFSLGSLSPLDDGYYRPADLPLLSQAQFVRMVRRFGAHRVLFGSDSPWDDQSAALARLRALPLTEAEREAILGENARQLLGIKASNRRQGRRFAWDAP